MDFKVQVEFVPGTLTDITPYVQGFDTQGGRSYEMDAFEAGTLTLTLDNSDGRFTPLRPASPYYPNVVPRRRVLLTATTTGTDSYTLFDGYVERWPVSISNGDATVTAPCSDLFGVLGRFRLKPFAQEWILNRKPAHYWPCDDAAGSPVAGNLVTVTAPAKPTPSKMGGAATLGEPSLLTKGEAGAGAAFKATSPDSYFLGGAGLVALEGAGTVIGPTWATSFVFKVPAGTPYDNTLMVMFDADGGIQWTITYAPSGYIVVTDPLGAVYSSFVINEADRGASHTVGVMVVPNTAAPSGYSIYWSVDDRTILTANLPAAPQSFTLGYVAYGGHVGKFAKADPSASGLHNQTVYMSHIALWPTYNVMEVYPFPLRSMMRDFYGICISGSATWPPWLLTDTCTKFAGLPTTATAPQGGFAQVSPGGYLSVPDWEPGTSLLEVVQGFADDAEAMLYGTTGGVAWVDRLTRLKAGPALTLGATPGTECEPGLMFEVDDQRITNDVTLTQGNGNNIVAQDAGSIATYDRVSVARDTALADVNDASALAQWIVYTRKDALVRCDSVQLTPLASAINLPSLLRLSYGAKLVLSNLPSQAPYSSATFFVEGISHNVVVDGETYGWTMTIQLSPADKWRAWVLEDPTYGAIDAGNPIVY